MEPGECRAAGGAETGVSWFPHLGGGSTRPRRLPVPGTVHCRKFVTRQLRKDSARLSAFESFYFTTLHFSCSEKSPASAEGVTQRNPLGIEGIEGEEQM